MHYAHASRARALGTLFLSALLQACLPNKNEDRKNDEGAASLAGTWTFEERENLGDRVRVTENTWTFLPGGNLRAIAEIRMEEGGVSTVLSRDTLGDSSRYAEDDPVPGILRVRLHVLPGSAACPGLLDQWYRYERDEGGFRVAKTFTYEGDSSSLAGAWRRVYCDRVEGNPRYGHDMREFSSDGKMTLRTYYEGGPDTLTTVVDYADSDSYFVTSGVVSGRQGYRIAAGRLFLYPEQADGSPAWISL